MKIILIAVLSLLSFSILVWANEAPCGVKEVISINGVSYKCDPKSRKMIIDEEAMESYRKYQKHKNDLKNALVSRVLTDSEMSEVLREGNNLFITPMVPFFQKDVDLAYYMALEQQFKLILLQNRRK